MDLLSAAKEWVLVVWVASIHILLAITAMRVSRLERDVLGDGDEAADDADGPSDGRGDAPAAPRGSVRASSGEHAAGEPGTRLD